MKFKMEANGDSLTPDEMERVVKNVYLTMERISMGHIRMPVGKTIYDINGNRIGCYSLED